MNFVMQSYRDDTTKGNTCAGKIKAGSEYMFGVSVASIDNYSNKL